MLVDAVVAIASVDLLISVYKCMRIVFDFTRLLHRLYISNSVDGLVHKSSSVTLKACNFFVYLMAWRYDGYWLLLPLLLLNYCCWCSRWCSFSHHYHTALQSTFEFVKPFIFARRMCALLFATLATQWVERQWEWMKFNFIFIDIRYHSTILTKNKI